MKTTISILRILVLLSLFMTTMFLIFCQPFDCSDTASWCESMMISKVTGFFLLFAFTRLYNAWKSDPCITRFEQWSIRTTER